MSASSMTSERQEAAELVGKIGGLMKRIGREMEFGEWVEGVRNKHKAKRNFMKRLEGVR